MLSDQELEEIKKWSEDPEELGAAILNEDASVYREISEGILRIIGDFQSQGKIFPTGKEEFFGVEDIYTQIQLQFEGGEDRLKD